MSVRIPTRPPWRTLVGRHCSPATTTREPTRGPCGWQWSRRVSTYATTPEGQELARLLKEAGLTIDRAPSFFRSRRLGVSRVLLIGLTSGEMTLFPEDWSRVFAEVRRAAAERGEIGGESLRD